MMTDNVLQEIKLCLENGNDPTSHVERLQSIVKQQEELGEVDHVAGSLIKFLVQTYKQPKIARKLAKIVSELEVNHADIVKQQILAHLDCNQTEVEKKELISAWSQLLECSTCARELLSDDLGPFLKVVCEGMSSLVSWDKVWTADVQDQLQVCVKVSLQFSQHLSGAIKTVVWGQGTPDTHTDQLQKLLSHLLSMLDVDVVYKDTQRLAATVFGYIVMLCDEPKCTAETFIKLLHGYKNHLNTEIGRLHITASSHTSKEKSELSDQRTDRQTEYGDICLMSGFISCCNTNLFMYGPISDDDGNKHLPTSCTLAEWMFVNIHRHSEGTNHPFLAFKTLQLWHQKINKVKACDKLQTSSFRFIVEQTLSLVWTNLDSPVDGVTECVMEVFRLLVETMTFYEDDFDELLHHVTGHVMQTSWQVKGKYLLCAVLLKHVDVVKFLDRFHDTWPQLLSCMSINYMSTPATDMYKAITTAILKESAEKWKSVCLSWLVEGITHSDKLTCYHVCHLWLPWTLKTVSNSYQWLLEELGQIKDKSDIEQKSNRNGTEQAFENIKKPDIGAGDWSYESKGRNKSEHELRARISVCMAARRLQIITLKDVPKSVAMEGLLHHSDDVRLDAFALICNSPKKTECVSEYEMDLLKLSLPHAMTSDTPPFRQQLQAHIHALVVRIRDGSMACNRELRQNSPQRKGSPNKESKPRSHGEIKEQLDQQLDFLEWLWLLCTGSLQPSANFQRLKTSLEWMWVILESIVYQQDKKRRKGGCPDCCSEFLPYAQNLGKCELFTYATAQTVLTSMLDGADDIRELACNILLEFFPSPLPLTPNQQPTKSENKDQPPSTNGCVDADTTAVCELLGKGLMLSKQPRAHEANSGALMCKLIYKRYVVESGWCFKRNTDNITAVLPSNKENTNLHTAAFLDILVSELERCAEVADQDMLKAAQNNGTHGILVAVQHCISVSLGVIQVETWRPLVERLVTVTKALVGTSLDILGGKMQPGGSAPSFEQMGLSIQTVIEESLGDSFQQDAILSEHHQLLMTWAWLNIRETSILYGKLASLPVSTTPHSLDVLTVEEIRKLGDVIVNILTRCRHRGAIEGSSVGLVQYCGHLLQRENPELHGFPRELVDHVIEQVLGAEATSVTRRSAGLPLIVQAVLASESKTKQSAILTYTVTKLLSIIEMPLPPATDQRLDLPHVHAFNILKVLFAEASIASSMVQYIEKASMLAIERFSSPVWALRNSATQLFSTLQNRILGQKRTKDDSIHTMTIEELFSHFPRLKPFLLTQLQGAAQEHVAGGLHPSLFPVMAILSKLNTGVQGKHSSSELSGYLDAIQSLAGSPIYAVRELSANALVPLVSPENMDQFLLESALDLPVSRDNCVSFNRLHGKLLQIQALLKSIQNRQEEGNVSDHLRSVLSERAWLCGVDNPCYIIKACYLQLMEDLCSEDGHINQLATQIINGDIKNEVGTWQLTKVVLHQWLDNDLLYERVQKCLLCDSADIQLVCVKVLRQKVLTGDVKQQDVNKMQILLFNFLKEDMTWELLCETLNCILELHCLDPAPVAQSPNREWEGLLMQLILQRGDSEPAALALSVFSILLKSYNKVTASVTDWINIVHRYSSPAETESKRNHAAQSLQLVGPNIISILLDKEQRITNNEMMALRLLQATVNLLTDEQSDCRETAAGFVCQLPWIPADCLHGSCHPSYCLSLLFKYVFAELCSSPVCMREMLKWLEPRQPAHVVIEEQLSGSSEIFEAQAVNPYSESHVLSSLISTFIWSQRGELSDSFGSPEIPVLLEELQQCVQALQAQSQGVVGPTCQGSVYEAVLCLLYRVHTLMVVMDNKQKNIIKSQLETLQTVPGIHTGLKKLSEVCDKLCSC